MNIIRKRILVIDDEKIYYLTIKNLLPADRFETIWVKNRAEALEQFNKRPPDLAVLDLRLSDRTGDTSGLALLKELRQSWMTIQIIVFTSYYMEPDMIVESMKSGAYYYFIKSQFDTHPNRFFDLVTEALDYRPRHDIVEDTYPHPLSLLYRDYRRNVVVPQLKFRRLIEVGELLVKLSAIISLAAIGHDDRASGARMVTNSLVKPSLGAWFEFLRYAVVQPSAQPVWLENMGQIFSAGRRTVVDSLVHLRNEWLGHGVTRADHEYTQMIEKWSGPLMDLLLAARIFSAWQFFVVRSTRKVAPEHYKHTVVNIRGHNPKFLNEQLELPVNCEADKLYVWDAAAQALLCLDPLLAMFVCVQCNQETVFVYEKLDRDLVVYLDYANGHQSTQIEPYRAVKNMLDPLGASGP